MREVRAANSVRFDGDGGLVVYDAGRQRERLLLSRISRLRITPIPPFHPGLLAGNIAVSA